MYDSETLSLPGSGHLIMIINFKIIRRSAFLALMLSVASCAYIEDGSFQEVSVRTPGAADSVCFLYTDGIKYRVSPPESIGIKKSSSDLTVECLAPGNRSKTKIIPATITNSAKKNAVNLGVGFIWDYNSGAMFQYPEIIEVNFIDEPLGGSDVPAYNNPDIRQPEDYPLEEFGPSDPALNEDANAPAIILRKRDGSIAKTSSMQTGKITQTTVQGKGNLQSVNNYGGSLNPAND